ncbi:MAG: amidase [Burkholderiales bacterium]|nr:amidase [Burkholderiales bacterium]
MTTTLAADLHYLELTEVAHLIQTRKVSPVEVTEAMLDRIAAVDGRLHSYALVTAELAMEQARRAEEEISRRRYRGALHGVPIGLKDLCYTKGIPTAAGMPIHRNFRPTFDGTVVKRLYDAGAVCVGKLQLTEGAFADHHPDVTVPVNPWHPDHWSGASSSGSGVATAAGLCYASIGSDTGGSIRFPSTANGVTGLKPTWGRVSRYGAFELAASLDHLGPMCRSAADCGIVLGAIAGADPNDPTATQKPVPDYLAGDDRSLDGVRIGVDERYIGDGVEPFMLRSTQEAIRVLTGLGAQIVQVRFPDVDQILRDWLPHCAVETAVAHEATFPSRRSEYGPGLSGLIDLARGVSAAAYQKILLRRRDFAGRVAAVFQSVDLLAIPGQFIASPTNAQMATLGQDPNAFVALTRFTSPFDMTGSPAITLTSGFTPKNTPVSFQLVSRHWDEALLVRAGRAYQRETTWHRQRPQV